MALFKRDKPEQEQKQEQYGTPVAAPQPRGDYSKGHPGLPPKDYKQPKER